MSAPCGPGRAPWAASRSWLRSPGGSGPGRSSTALRARPGRGAARGTRDHRASPPCAAPGGGAWWPAGSASTSALRPAVAAYYRSQFLNATLPGGVLGDVHRAVRHGRDVGDLGGRARSVVWDRGAGQAVQVALTVLVLLVLPSPSARPSCSSVPCWSSARRRPPRRRRGDTRPVAPARVLRTAAGDLRGILLVPGCASGCWPRPPSRRLDTPWSSSSRPGPPG